MRKLATFSFSFSAAVFLAQYAVPASWLLPIAALFVVLGIASAFVDRGRKLASLLLAFGFAAGLAWDYTYSALVYLPYTALDQTTVPIAGVVTDYPQETDSGGVSVCIKLDNVGPVKAKTLLYADSGTDGLCPGDRITLTAKLSLSDTAFNTKTYYYLSKGVFLIANQKSAITTQKAEKLPVKYVPVYLSKKLREKIVRIFEADTAPFMLAFLSGDRTLLNRDTLFTSAMSVTGITHVVAVSGMHIAFLIGFLLMFTRRRRLNALLGIPIIFIFMAMMGFSASVARAGIVQILLLIAPLANRENDPATSLGLSLFVLLAFNPFAARDIGLQLSYASVAGILLFSEKFNRRIMRGFEKIPLFRAKYPTQAAHFLSAGLSGTLSALVFTTPLIAAGFGYISLVAPLTNLLLLWAVSATFILGLVCVALGFVFVPFGVAAAWLTSWPVRLMCATVRLLARIPYAALYMRSVYISVWFVLACGVIVWLLFSKKKHRPVIPLCSVAVGLCLAVLLSGTAGSGGLTVTAVDVGQGQSIVLLGKNSTVVVDCGGNKAANVGNSTADYLLSINRRRIDLLVITHFHADHADGIAELMRRVRVAAIAVPPFSDGEGYDDEYLGYETEITALAQSLQTDIIYVDENKNVLFPDLTARLFAPIGASGENERGVCALFSCGASDALVTGDINSALERRLLMNASLPDIELLIVGHHGSRNSSCDELLDAVKPETAIISVGRNNYGHPSPETLGRLARDGITVFRTDKSGTVTCKIR